jgi:hypothetical protein
MAGGPAAAGARQNDRVPVIKAEYGPTMPELVGGLPRAARVAAIAFGALVVLAAIAIALRSRSGDTALVVRGPVTFNLSSGPQLRHFSQPGSLLALRQRRGGLFLDSYVVRRLNLPAYQGAVGGLLPVYSDKYLAGLLRRYGPSFDLVQEGRTRINNGIGYQLVLRGTRDGRALYVRHLLLVPEAPDGVRQGVVVELESTPASGTPNALGNGNAGALKQALRSFRFGTSTTGGTQ